LRRVLVVWATAVIKQVTKGGGQRSPWLVALVKRKPPKLAAVALANKTARIAWKLMVSGERYDRNRAAAAGAGRCAAPARGLAARPARPTVSQAEAAE
jgi:transposase